MAVHYKDFGCELEYITDKSQEGTQFVKGFSGMGGFLRYKIDTDHLLNTNDDYEEDEDEDFI